MLNNSGGTIETLGGSLQITAGTIDNAGGAILASGGNVQNQQRSHDQRGHGDHWHAGRRGDVDSIDFQRRR